MRNPEEVEEVSRDLSIDPIGKNVMFDNDIDMRTFLFSKRYHFGVNGWDSLVGDAETVVIDGDHFSIVRKPHVSHACLNLHMPSSFLGVY
jgi:thioesterase domain-containing protein